MTAIADRPLRADAARNAERILRAARDVYGEFGPDAPIGAIARRASVGERTLYRRFPTKADLIRAALTAVMTVERAANPRTERLTAPLAGWVLIAAGALVAIRPGLIG